MKRLRATLLLAGLVLTMTLPRSLQAQWITESFSLKSGWNAVYLHVDASHTTLNDLVGTDFNNPILEVWMWAPAPSTIQFVNSPAQATDESSQWLSWVRLDTSRAGLQRLVGNAAYLVRVSPSVGSYTWTIKGRPVAPAYRWTSTGLNFLGFPTAPANPPTFDQFLAQSPDLQQYAEIHQYVGGDLISGVNPGRLYNTRTARVNRGQAYWIKAGELFNRYFGPFEVTLVGSAGVDFSTGLSTYRLRLANLTPASLGVGLQLLPSEAPPIGQPAISRVPPLLVRGSINPTNLTYGYTTLPVGSSPSWTLAAAGNPGSEVEIILGLNRSAIKLPVGSLLAGVLRLTDSLGQSQVDVPVSARTASNAGLWVGSAAVSQVGEYLKNFAASASDPGQLQLSESGSYVVNGVNTNWGAVPRPFPLRLILHNPEGAGNAVLLQRVYCGVDNSSNAIVARSESNLNPDFLKQARRISSSHLPWSNANTAWNFNGRLGETTNLAVTVTLDYADQASNPFLHTYHPDHDNLAANFQTMLPQGSESYTVRRDISLVVKPPPDDFASLTGSSPTLSGDYSESISVIGLARSSTNDTRRFQVRGSFSLNRIATVPTLAP